MSAVDGNEAIEKPLDPAMERVRRKMVRLLVISIGVMMAGLMAVLYTLVHKISERPIKAVAPLVGEVGFVAIPGKEIDGTIALPTGAQINNQSLSGSRVLMDVTLTDGKRQTIIYDVIEQRIIARLDVTNVQ
jgi:hypothetical protein